jgi:hypothetical protein
LRDVKVAERRSASKAVCRSRLNGVVLVRSLAHSLYLRREKKVRVFRLAAVRLGMMADARAVIIIWSWTWLEVGLIRAGGGSFGEAVRRWHRRKSSLVVLNWSLESRDPTLVSV